MTTTTPDLGILGEAIEAGHYDDHLDAIVTAVEKRRIKVSPWPALAVLANVWEMVERTRGAAVQQRAEIGAEANHRLRRVLADYADNPLVMELGVGLRREVLVTCLNMTPEAARAISDADLQPPTSVGSQRNAADSASGQSSQQADKPSSGEGER